MKRFTCLTHGLGKASLSLLLLGGLSAHAFDFKVEDLDDHHNFYGISENKADYTKLEKAQKVKIMIIASSEIADLIQNFLVGFMADYDESYAPIIYRAQDPTLRKFGSIVQEAINKRVDFVLNYKHFPGMGNPDGTGGMNATISKACRSGIIWIQSAGLHQGRVFNGRVGEYDSKDKKLVKIQEKDKLNNVVFFNVLRSRTPVSMVLNWDLYPNSDEMNGVGTDLDLYLFKLSDEVNSSENFSLDFSNPLASSTQRQIYKQDSQTNTKEGETILPMESIPEDGLRMVLSKGSYALAIKHEKGTFRRDNAHFRVILETEKPFWLDEKGKLLNPVAFRDVYAAKDLSSLVTPAAHPFAITVGNNNDPYALYTSQGLSTGGISKPEVLLDKTRITFDNEKALSGPDAATTIWGALSAMVLAKIKQDELALQFQRQQLLYMYVAVNMALDKERGRYESLMQRSPQSAGKLEKSVYFRMPSFDTLSAIFENPSPNADPYTLAKDLGSAVVTEPKTVKKTEENTTTETASSDDSSNNSTSSSNQRTNYTRRRGPLARLLGW